MMDAINKVFARILGKDVKVIENEQRFFEFARKFAAATRGEQVEITDPGIQDQDLAKRPDESEAQHKKACKGHRADGSYDRGAKSSARV